MQLVRRMILFRNGTRDNSGDVLIYKLLSQYASTSEAFVNMV